MFRLTLAWTQSRSLQWISVLSYRVLQKTGAGWFEIYRHPLFKVPPVYIMKIISGWGAFRSVKWNTFWVIYVWLAVATWPEFTYSPGGKSSDVESEWRFCHQSSKFTYFQKSIPWCGSDKPRDGAAQFYFRTVQMFTMDGQDITWTAIDHVSSAL